MREPRGTLLIVDDDPVIRASMHVCLTEIGYKVRLAKDGLDALIAISEEAPDILLTDLNMPRMSGFELLAHLHTQFPGVQTIGMSGTFCGDEVPSGVLADAFYQKGSTIGALLRIIENLPSHSPQNAKRATQLAPLWVLEANNGQMDPARPKGNCPA